jgi:hypothetical protein
MSKPNTTRWIGIGLLGVPIYGVLTFWTSLDPQPDPGTQLEAWARFVTTNEYLLEHLFGSLLGMILVVFGTFALGAQLARSRAGGMGLWAMVITVLGNLLYLTIGGVSALAVPEEGQAVLLGLEEYEELPDIPADTALIAIYGLAFLLLFVGNVLLAVAIWRSGTLPKWAGAIWGASAVFVYLLSAVWFLIAGAQVTPPTVLVGMALLVISGAWMAWSVLSRPDAAQAEAGTAAQRRVR